MTHSLTRYLAIICIVLGAISCALIIARSYLEQSTDSTTRELNMLADQQAQEQADATSSSTQTKPQNATDISTASPYVVPVSYFPDGITKKPFGLLVSPQNSPIKNEQFTGYHAGADIEVPARDIDKDISVYAIADGQVKFVEQVDGLGGVVIMQFVTNGLTYSASYSYLKKLSISVRVGDTVKRGQKLGILGSDRSTDTEGERKHLQFTIHKDFDITTDAYVKNKKNLNAFVDPATFLAHADPITALTDR